MSIRLISVEKALCDAMFKKSWAGDLQEKYPDGHWITVGDEDSPLYGRHLFVHGEGRDAHIIAGGSKEHWYHPTENRKLTRDERLEKLGHKTQAWQLTKDEWMENVKHFSDLNDKEKERAVRNYVIDTDDETAIEHPEKTPLATHAIDKRSGKILGEDIDAHDAYVKQAIKEGKQVSEEVKKDYPLKITKPKYQHDIKDFQSDPVKKVSYKITKRGNKWIEGTNEKGYKAQIAINEASDNFKVGEQQSFPAHVKFEQSRYGAKTTIYPLSSDKAHEQTKKQETTKNTSEIKRWLGYIEEKAPTGYWYENGASKVTQLGIKEHPELFKRYQEARKTATIAGHKEQAKRALGWIEENLSKYWYHNGELKTKEAIDGLKKEGIDASKYEKKLIELKEKFDSSKKVAYEKKEKQKERERTGGFEGKTYDLYGGSGYRHSGWKRGDVIRNSKEKIAKGEPEYLYVLSASSEYFREDGLSFGVGDDQGYLYRAKAREATAEEAKPVIETRQKKADQDESKTKLNSIAKLIQDKGERPQGNSNIAEGDEYDMSTGGVRIVGGGEWFKVGKDYIWYVKNNGGDGDMWSYNNIRTGGAGAIGWRVPYTKELADEIKKNHERGFPESIKKSFSLTRISPIFQKVLRCVS